MLNEKKVKKKSSIKKGSEEDHELDFKECGDLLKEFEDLKECIENNYLEDFKKILVGLGIKYFLTQNDLDYDIFKHCIKFKRQKFLDILKENDYQFNTNMILIELYDSYIGKRSKKQNEKSFLKKDDYTFLITKENGKYIETNQCLVELYFLLISQEYNLALLLLQQDYASHLREDINEMFIGDEKFLIEHILKNKDIAKEAIKFSLERQLDGVAFEISNFSGFVLDEDIMIEAVEHECHLYLEEVWESSRKFGDIRNFYANKISFSVYIECMIFNKKFDMASDAIKNWFESYKEENVFSILLEQKCEELLIDLFETASTYNYTIEFSEKDFETIVKNHYFLLKVILSKPNYKTFLNSENIQKNLMDPLRSGQTILPAIECYSAIEEHLLVIAHIEKAGKVLVDFLKNPKKFTICRYPILLCCLVAEFMLKLKKRFTVYESFFDQIYNGFINAGYLMTNKIKDTSILEYHLNRKDIKNRTCLQIMCENRLYGILFATNIGGIIGKYWTDVTEKYSIMEASSFNYLCRYNLEEEMYSFKNLADKYNKNKFFVFNYYSFRDCVYIRYYFKEFYVFPLIALYEMLIYFAVTDKDLENTINNKYPVLSKLVYIGSLLLVMNRISSIIFFQNVTRWYMEIDYITMEIIFFISIIFHWYDFKKYFTTDPNIFHFFSAILISFQILFLWFKAIDSLKSTKLYGGFLRTVMILVKKLVLLFGFFFSFILVCTGCFNLFFQQYLQFGTYFDSFFYLSGAALQQFHLDSNWNIFINFALMFFMGACTLILLNLIIAYSTKIYDDVDDNIDAEHTVNLIKIYEYLKWDKSYGIFKFLHAPFNVIQMPLAIFTLFLDNKEYWVEIFCKILYFPIAVLFFLAFVISNLIKIPYVYLHHVIIKPFKSKNVLRDITVWITLGPIFIAYYFLLDLKNFWSYAYREQIKEADHETRSLKILEFKKLFSQLVSEFSEKVASDKFAKKISIIELVGYWIVNTTSTSKNFSLEDNNKMHKRSLIIHKYQDENLIFRSNHLSILKKNSKNTFFSHFTNILHFLTKFADKDGYIEKDLAKNIFPKRNYYDDEYFEFLYYFNYKYFLDLIREFTKHNNEVKKEMNNLRGIYMDIRKIKEKFVSVKGFLKNIPFKNMLTINNGISFINNIFAIFENNLTNSENKEFYKKILQSANKNKNEPSYDKAKNKKIMTKLYDMKEKNES